MNNKNKTNSKGAESWTRRGVSANGYWKREIFSTGKEEITMKLTIEFFFFLVGNHIVFFFFFIQAMQNIIIVGLWVRQKIIPYNLTRNRE